MQKVKSQWIIMDKCNQSYGKNLLYWNFWEFFGTIGFWGPLKTAAWAQQVMVRPNFHHWLGSDQFCKFVAGPGGPTGQGTGRQQKTDTALSFSCRGLKKSLLCQSLDLDSGHLGRAGQLGSTAQVLLLLLPGHAMNGSAELWQSRVGLDLSSPETSLTSLSLVSLFAVAQWRASLL